MYDGLSDLAEEQDEQDLSISRPWGSDSWSCTTNDLVDALGNKAVSHDEILQLQEIIKFGGQRKVELTKFLITGYDTFTLTEKEEISQLDFADMKQMDHFFAASKRQQLRS